MTSVRVLASLAASNGWPTHQWDIVTAFLNADVEEEVYIHPLPHFPPADGDAGARPAPKGKVHRLLKALYGIRQAPRNWYLHVSHVLTKLGFTQSPADPGVYTRQDSDGAVVMYLVIYVDDILVAAADEAWVRPLQTQLEQHFEMKYLGRASWVLGMAWDQDLRTGTITLHQQQYVKDLLSKFNMTACSPAPTPMALGFKWDAPSPALDETNHYAALVGSLNWAAVCTRPDISAAVSVLSRSMSKPTQQDWTAAKRVLRYLSGTMHRGLTYSQHTQPKDVLCGWADTSYANAEDSRSTGGAIHCINGAAIAWQAFVLPQVALSTAEAEYYGLGAAAQDTIHLRELLRTMGCPQEEPTVLHEDNQACIALATNPLTNKKTRHIQVKHHL